MHDFCSSTYYNNIYFTRKRSRQRLDLTVTPGYTIMYIHVGITYLVYDGIHHNARETIDTIANGV